MYLDGYLRKDQFGRVYIDTCPTDEIHLTSAPPEGQERHRCRKYLDDLFISDIEMLGKRVRLKYVIHVECCEDNHE